MPLPLPPKAGKKPLPPKKAVPPKKAPPKIVQLPDDASERNQHRRWRRMVKGMRKQSLALYASEVLRGPPEYGGKFLLGSHHFEVARALRYHDRVEWLAARDHGKSLFLSMAYPLWQADIVSPGKLGYVFSGSDKLAEDLLDRIRMEILGGGENGGPNPRLQHLLPFKRDSKGTIKFANNSEIRARGFGTKARGGHPWWVVGDDMGDDEWIYSTTTRKRAIDYFLSAIRPMVVPGGQLVVVGTPFHSRDLYNHLEETGVYHIIKSPAINAVTGQALWPERYDLERLALVKKELGSELRFSREYLTRPISDDSSLFPGYLFDLPGIKQPYALGVKASYWASRGMAVYVGVDLAMSANVGADFMVLFVMAVDDHGNRWIVDIIRRKGLGYQEQVDLIVRVSKRYDATLVFCEANQYQRVISDMVIRVSDVPLKAFRTTGKEEITTQKDQISQHVSVNKNAFDRGVPALRMLFENGKIRIPWNKETRDEVNTWISEMQSFGWADGKLTGVGAHDDTVLSMWFAEKAAEYGSKYTLSFLDRKQEEGFAAQIPDYWESGEDVEDRQNGSNGHAAVVKPNGKAEEPDFFGFGTRSHGLTQEDEEEWVGM